MSPLLAAWSNKKRFLIFKERCGVKQGGYSKGRFDKMCLDSARDVANQVEKREGRGKYKCSGLAVTQLNRHIRAAPIRLVVCGLLACKTGCV